MQTCELFHLIPREKLDYLFTHSDRAGAEMDPTFLGFEDVYRYASLNIPKDKIILDLGCAYATQSYYFTDFEKYIGVDIEGNENSVIHTDNSAFYFTSIQDFIENIYPTLNIEKQDVYAICSAVPDKEAVNLAKATFPNLLYWYPGDKLSNKALLEYLGTLEDIEHELDEERRLCIIMEMKQCLLQMLF